MKVVRSATFDRWLRKLNDRRAAARVLVRIERLAAGNPGDVTPVVVLLCGGDKSSQADDIDSAHRIAADWRSQTHDEHNA